MPASLPAGTHRLHALVEGRIQPAAITVDGAGRVAAIERVGHATGLDADAPVACPVPVDLHIHGGFGFSTHTAEGIAALASRLAPLEFVATLPLPGTAPRELLAALPGLAAAADAAPTCRGLRIEGLFINPHQRGVWDVAGLAPCDPGLLRELAAAAGRQLVIVDVAPELPGAIELVEVAGELGITTAIAHTTADAATARRGFDAGIRLATHTFNAMTPVHHRRPGAAVAALLDDRVCCELVADGQHLAPETLLLALRASGSAGCALVSDASPVAGTPAGTTMQWGPLELERSEQGSRTADGALAGGGMLLHEALAGPPAGVDAAAWLGAGTASGRRVLDPSAPDGLAVGDRAVLVEIARARA